MGKKLIIRKNAASLEVQVGGVLKSRKKTLALAESCAGGLISSRITDVPGSSDYFKGSVIAYSNDIKSSVLNISDNIISKYGAVSSQVAGLMATSAKKHLKSDMAASITGIAGPGGGSKQKPVGLAYIGFSKGKTTKVKKVKFEGSRKVLKKKFSDAVLQIILKNV